MIRKTVVSFALLAAALACGCGREDNSENSNRGDLRVQLAGEEEPLRQGDFDFGAVEVGDSKKVTLVLENVGTDLARITSTRFEDAPAGTFFVQAPTDVGPGDTADLRLTFSPTKAGPAEGRLVIEHDGTSVNVSLNLHGEGVAP